MDCPLVTRQGVDAAYEIPDNVSRLGAAVEGSNPPKRPLSCAYKAPRRSPHVWSIFFLASSSVPSPASLSQSTHSLVWISEVISMASTWSQPIAHSYPYASIVELGFQFLKPPPSEVFEYRICLVLAKFSSFTSLSNDRSLQFCLFSTLDTFDSNPQARHLPTAYTIFTSTSSTLQSVPATSDPAPLPLSPTLHSPSHPHAPQSTRSATVPRISPHHPPSPLTTSRLAHAAQPRHPGESS
jgi:hypothetical protein